ncbi:NERD domain-containing protein [Oceanimonas sp. CHS3-5]|uniref:nuclease-related domain-containing protein n=1 Tax=Oceanimonas sp. CHS3-5 TaxID=3068186 RepID=UPI00273E1234|nr:NERD domain-containing protein [Oceanimonas sp. CHS3-5]MDP5292561.1 NERD domain-containing protein [Oceanimonas sp. CHS3-5]
MTILKNKEPMTSVDPRWIAGDKQERDVAFYLRRAFKDDENILVLNDYCFTHLGETAQIDHLIVHRAGFIIIESKSIYGEVKLNSQDEWSRSYQGRWSGMPSPIIQAELQRDLLRSFLSANVEHFLGKVLGLQLQVGRREWDVLCTVSNTCILHRDTMTTDMNKKVVKSESIAEQVKSIGGYSLLGVALSSKAYFSMKDFQRIGDFLMASVTSPEHASVSEALSENYACEVEKEVKQESQTKADVPANAQNKDIKSEKEIGLNCKNCGSNDQLSAHYGKYGYYVKCGHCGVNTSMKIKCPSCGIYPAKVSKFGNEYWLSCQCTFVGKLYEQR